ncbi:hypothetical protein BDV28DRAFT_144780 [Aspergillus coremiiformis]|uniref:Yeast cell wall synthesis Kre9/Knh1-like N-terminal domain-containing protein n=1 Tax=Aspergillus coremiiformis TaxID=138285 RepID=A0A5N6ZGR4_9EURO|nr:hypothetical protein BDV28DRAFT_144780 [Aspergillus coremiiformis]
MRITTPKAGDCVDVTHDWKVCWEHVDTDPRTFSLWLTHLTSEPAEEVELLATVNTFDSNCVTVPGRQLPIRGGDRYRVWATAVGETNPCCPYSESADFRALVGTACPPEVAEEMDQSQL